MIIVIDKKSPKFLRNGKIIKKDNNRFLCLIHKEEVILKSEQFVIIDDKIRDKIPKGLYCYYRDENGFNLCQYWNITEDKIGHCSLLNLSDEEDTITLFDQVKECGIKRDMKFSKRKK